MHNWNCFMECKNFFTSRRRRKNQVQASSINDAKAKRVTGVKVLAVIVLFSFIFYILAWMQMIITGSMICILTQKENFGVAATLIWMLKAMLDGIAFLFCRQDIRKVVLDLPIEMQENFALSSFLLWMITPLLDGIVSCFADRTSGKCAWKLIRSK